MTAPYQFMPALAADEQEQLRADIERYGVRVPVDVDEDGQILDGHHRAAIAADLGIDYPTRVLTGLSEQQKRAHVLSTNVHRRHLTREQRRDLVASLVRTDPAASNREHARQAGVDDKTVASVRTQLEESAEIPHFSERRDPRTRNLTQPAGRPTMMPEPAPEPGIVDPELEARADEVLQEANENLRRRRYKHDWISTLANAYKLTAYEPETIANLASSDEIESLEMFTASIVTYTRSVKRHRANLRVVGGAR